MTKNGKAVVFVGILSLIANYRQWIDRPLGDLIRGLYFLEANWDDCFKAGTDENDALLALLPKAEDQKRLKQFVMYIVPQADRAERVMYYENDRDRHWLSSLNHLLTSHGFKSIPTSGWRPEEFGRQLRLHNPRLEIFA